MHIGKNAKRNICVVNAMIITLLYYCCEFQINVTVLCAVEEIESRGAVGAAVDQCFRAAKDDGFVLFSAVTLPMTDYFSFYHAASSFARMP